MRTTNLTIGELSITVAQLTLGQMKNNRATVEQVLALKSLASDQMPTNDMLEAMVTVVQLAQKGTAISREAIAAAFDDMPFGDGVKELAAALTAVMTPSRPGVPAKGEAESPAVDSITSGSTGSSSPQPDGPSAPLTDSTSTTRSTS